MDGRRAVAPKQHFSDGVMTKAQKKYRYDRRVQNVARVALGSLYLDQPFNLLHLTFFEKSQIIIFWFVYPS
jgi:hypothetical protein